MATVGVKGLTGISKPCKSLALALNCGVSGCGGYADNRSGASSSTGHGEGFMKTCLAKHVAVLMEQGDTL